MACSIPFVPLGTACQADVGISATGQSVPSVDLQVKISLPIKELLQALSQISVPNPTVATVATVATGSSQTIPQGSKVVPAGPAVSPSPVFEKMVVSNVSKISRVSSLTQSSVTSVASATSVTSKPPFGVSGSWELSEMPGSCSVRVSNLLKRMTSQHLQQAFGHRNGHVGHVGHVGPVLDCSVEKGSACLTFGNHEDARKAVERYHGGILEITETDGDGKDGTGEVVSLWPNTASMECLQDHLGPLSKCSLRGGDGWVTVFVSSRVRQLKRERGQSRIGFKASFISACLDSSGASGAGAGALSRHISFLKSFPFDL